MDTKSKIIKVLLVDDSLIALKVLERILSTSPDIRVVGTAKSGKEGIELIPELNPDVICTDLHMPVMDGYEFTKEVMARYPRPILVISVSVQEGSHNIFKLLEAGAVDVFAKPRSGTESEFERVSHELISKVRMLSGVVVFHRPPQKAGVPIVPRRGKPFLEGIGNVQIVAIGASAGGPQTLQMVLSQLPANYPLPVVCVQHIGEQFVDGFVKWLGSQCRMNVRIAQFGEFPQPGTVYFPKSATHLIVDTNGGFLYSTEPPYNGHRPSITVTFRAIAGYYKNGVIGILLTGMGTDGVEGMRAILQAGGITIAQDQKSSIVFGMPKAAIELGAAKYILSPEEIAGVLIQYGVANETRNTK